MAAPIKPGVKQAFGNDGWGFVPAIASLSAPTLAEIQAVAGLTLSCFLFREQEGVTGDTAKVTLPALLCETSEYESIGPTKYSMSDLIAAFHPQAAASTDGKKAWETLTDRATGFLWRRQGVAATTDTEAGQFIDVVPVQLGVKFTGKTGTGPEGVYTFTCPVGVTAEPKFNVAISAT